MSAKIDIETREFAIEDYDAVLDLWQRVEGLDIAEGDDRETIRRYLKRNRGLSRVAVIARSTTESAGAERSRRESPRGLMSREANQSIVGAVLCGHDGRRGYIYHLAVDPAYQELGIGRRLAAECRERLKDEGLERVNILVAQDNPRGREFWKCCGWEELDGAVAMGGDI